MPHPPCIPVRSVQSNFLLACTEPDICPQRWRGALLVIPNISKASKPSKNMLTLYSAAR